MKRTPNSVLVALARSLPPVQLQNRLMRSGDREIAMAMLYMADVDRERIVASLGPEKGRRVREELSFQKHVRISYDQYRAAAMNLTDTLRKDTGASPLRSYIRPVRGRRS